MWPGVSWSKQGDRVFIELAIGLGTPLLIRAIG